MAMTVKSGRWSDPTVWDTGAVPGAGAVAHILAGHEIIYDLESDVILHDVMSEMGSRLTWDATKETKLRVNTVMLSGITEMVDNGLSATPGKPKHEIVFHPIAGKEPGAGMGLGAVFMGPTRIHGFSKKGHLRSGNLSIPSGATTITLPGLAASGWRVGDVLVVLGTEYVLPATSDPQYSGPTQFWYMFKDAYPGKINLLDEYQFGQDEERKITAITGDVVTLDAPLTYTHTGMTGTLKDGNGVTVKPVVANVSRSIRFRTATAEEDGQLDPNADITVLQKRAHLMFMRQSDVDLRYFETKNMGRTSTDPSLLVNGLPYSVERSGGLITVDKLRATSGGALLENPDNVRGRYAIHAHHCERFHLIGATAWAPVGGHPIPGWSITHHSGWGAIEDCVVSNGRGAGMVAEVGSERGQWAGNVVTGLRGDGDRAGWGSRSEHFSNHNGSVGIAFEFQSRALLVHDNIAGSSKYAFAWHAQKDFKWLRSPRDVDIRLVDGFSKAAAATSEFWQDETMGHITPQIPPMLGNEAWACRFGFSVIHRLAGSDLLSRGDKTPMLMERFHCVNVPFPWEVPQYSNTYYVKDCLFQGPLNMMSTSKAAVLGNVSWDWNFSNCHFRNFNKGFSNEGAGLNYEGNFFDITFENVTEPVPISGYATITNITTHPLKNVMGDWTDHPTDPNRAIIRQWRVLDGATELPTPYPLAPYGRKLPANRPDGTPYPPVNPGDTPYFVLGDGTNGAATTAPVAISLTLTAGQGRGQGRVHGIIRDSVGDRRWPDWQSSETFPSNISIKSHRTLGKLTPEQLVQRWGCWNDAGTWKCRTWFYGADRFTHVRFTFHVDFTLAGFEADFLAGNDLGGPPSAPEWPDQLEVVPAPQPLTAVAKTLQMLSRTRLEVVEGQALSHRLRPNEVLTTLAIAGGADAAMFRVENQRLVWAGAGATLRPEPYEVTIRVTDSWGNTVEVPHQVIVVSSARVSAQIVDDFNRADEALEANPAYLLAAGNAGTFAIRTNRLAVIAGGTGAIYNLGDLGTSEQEISAQFSGYTDTSSVLFRMVDVNNWLSFRRNDAAAAHQLYMCVNGVITRLCNFSNEHNVTLRVQGRKLVFTKQGNSAAEPIIRYPTIYNYAGLKVLDLDPLAEPGALILPIEAPMGTQVGLRAGHASSLPAVNPWIDSFSAKALES